MQLVVYIIYIISCFTITVIVGKHLHRNGYYLILELFSNEQFTRTINNLLLIGYYLVNLGYVATTVGNLRGAVTVQKGVEILSHHIGWILVLLGIMHVNNIIMLNLFSKQKEKLIELFT